MGPPSRRHVWLNTQVDLTADEVGVLLEL